MLVGERDGGLELMRYPYAESLVLVEVRSFRSMFTSTSTPGTTAAGVDDDVGLEPIVLVSNE